MRLSRSLYCKQKEKGNWKKLQGRYIKWSLHAEQNNGNDWPCSYLVRLNFMYLKRWTTLIKIRSGLNYVSVQKWTRLHESSGQRRKDFLGPDFILS